MIDQSHKSKTITGIKWSFLSQFALQIISILVGVVLSRILLPKEFGLIGMILIFSGFLTVITDLGIGSAVIHKKDISKKMLSTAFWLNCGINLSITVILFFSAPFVAVFYEKPILTGLTQLISFAFIISSISGIQTSLLSKEMDFKSLFFINLIKLAISSPIAIILALNGFGVWALAFQQIVSAVASAITPFFFHQWRPAFVFSKKDAKSFLSFGTPLLANSSLNYWVRNLDNLLIGKFMGENSLAYYNKSYQLMLLPVTHLAGSIKNVMFPSFAKLQNDYKLLQSYYLKTISILSLVTFPLMGGLSVLATPTIVLIYGDEWLPAAQTLQILCIIGALQSISTVAGSVFLAIGETKKMLYVSLFAKATMISGIVAGLQYGVTGIAIGYSIGSFIGFLPELYYTGRSINLSLIAIIQSFYRSLFIAFSMCLIVFLVYNYSSIDSMLGRFLLSILAGIVSYYLISKVFNKELINSFIAEIRQQF